MIRYFAVAGVALLLSACQVAPYKAENFAGKKTFALVTIMATEEMHGGNSGASIFGLIKAAFSKDSGFSASTEEVFAQTVPRIERAFRQQKALRVLSARKIKNHPAYKAEPGGPAEFGFLFMKTRMRVAPGYKVFHDEARLKALARKLKVDGVIMVTLQYGVAEAGVGVGGLVSAGTHRPTTMMTVQAIDKDGNRLWMEQFRGEAKRSYGFVGGDVNFVKLRPGWIQATDDALQSMRDRLSGKT